MMRILSLAKELGVSYERLLNWLAQSNMAYSGPDDEIDPEHEKQVRQAFLPGRLGGRPQSASTSSDDAPVEQLLDEIIDPSLVDIENDLPDSLEELEAIERELMKSPPELRRAKPPVERIRTKDALARFGISGKSALKKLRKLLPGNVSRLLNLPDLSQQQNSNLVEEILSRAVFFCDHAYCRSALERRHSPESLFPVRDAALCELCQGSATVRALEEAAEVCGDAGVRRILVVGGMPASLNEIRNNTPHGLEFRLVEGDLDRHKQRVQADLRWCDLALIWGSTILQHSVSQGYTHRKTAGGPFIIRVQRRSVEALCSELTKHLKGRDKKV